MTDIDKALERLEHTLSVGLREFLLLDGLTFTLNKDLIRDDLNLVKTELQRLQARDTPLKWIEVSDEHGTRDECPLCHYPSYNDLGHNHFCTVCGQRLDPTDDPIGVTP